MSDPSDAAVSAACCAGGTKAGSWTHYTNGIVRAGLGAAHDEKLGLDRSVCLRDVIDAVSAYNSVAAFLEREFLGAAPMGENLREENQ